MLCRALCIQRHNVGKPRCSEGYRQGASTSDHTIWRGYNPQKQLRLHETAEQDYIFLTVRRMHASAGNPGGVFKAGVIEWAEVRLPTSRRWTKIALRGTELRRNDE